MGFSRHLLVLWLVLNLLSMPLSVLSDEPSSVELSSSSDVADAGYFARLSSFSYDLPSTVPSASFSHSAPLPLLFVYSLIVISLGFFLSFSMGSKAQVTIFMLLGIIVIGSFSSLYYISHSLTKTKLDAQVDAIVDELLQRTAVEEYVTSCIAEASKEGLKLIGEQGGKIFPYQNGSVLTYMPEAVQYPQVGGINRSLLILPPVSKTISDFLPYYPCPCMPLAHASCAPENTSMCSPYSYSDPLISEYVGSPVAFENPCCYDKDSSGDYVVGEQRLFPLYRIPNPPAWASVSIQDELESYIANRTKECADLDQFADLLGYDIEEGDISVEVTPTHGDVVIDVIYPLIVTVLGEEPITRFLKVHASVPVRLRKVYAFAAKIVDEENSDVDASPQGIYDEIMASPDNSFVLDVMGFKFPGEPPIHTIDSAIKLSVYKNVLPGFDLINITDMNSMLDNSPYSFVFMRKNRYPALDYIGKYPQDFEYNGQRYDFHLSVNDSLVLSPEAVDPDEDIIKYLYEGWLETRDEYFDRSLFISENCTYFPQRCVVVNSSAGEPHILTSSDYYTTAGNCFERCSNYTITERDMGAHVIKISAFDGSLSDYQHVRVLVTDTPRADARGNNNYTDIEDSSASIEDPYILSALASKSLFCNVVKFKWLDADELTSHPIDPHILYYGPDPFASIPLNPNISNMSIPGEPFNNVTNETPHQISLFLEHDCGAPTPPGEMEVNVWQCLPHRSDAPSFPYNNEGENFSLNSPFGFDASVAPYNYTEPNPFQANHTCCLNMSGFYMYAPQSVECFRYEQSACAFTDPSNPAGSLISSSEKLYPATLTDDVVSVSFSDGANPVPVSADSPYANDFFTRTYSVNCSGDRGNICDGPKQDVFVLNASCDVCQICDPSADGGCRNYSASETVVCDNTAMCDGDVLYYRTCNGSADGCDDSHPDPQYGRMVSQNSAYDYGLLDTSRSHLVAVDCSAYYSGFTFSTDDNGDPFSRTRLCIGTCFSNGYNAVGNDACVTYNYTCGGSPSGNTCVVSSYIADLDMSNQMCQSCSLAAFDADGNSNGNQGTRWVHAGENGVGEYGSAGSAGCCGDDEGEYFTRFVSGSAGTSSSSSSYVCCNADTDCSFAGSCYSDGNLVDHNEVYNPHDEERCYLGVWYDQDFNETMCNHTWEDMMSDASLGDWMSSSGICCGDDDGEDGIAFCRTDGTATVACGPASDEEWDSCCPAGNCVYYEAPSTSCYANGSAHLLGNSYEFCNDAGVWFDPDASADYCTFEWFTRSNDTFDPAYNIDDYNNNLSDGFCCGDDNGEGSSSVKPLYFNGSENILIGDEEPACCPADYCSYNGSCYGNSTYFDVYPESGYSSGAEVCLEGVWYDPDSSPDYCADPSDWIKSSGYCCGDDANDMTTVNCLFGASHGFCSGSGSMCCKNPQTMPGLADCFINATCYESDPDSGTSYSFFDNGEQLRCWNASWYDPDFNDITCRRFAEFVHNLPCTGSDCWVAEGEDHAFGEYGDGLGGEGQTGDDNTEYAINGTESYYHTANPDTRAKSENISECCGDDANEVYVVNGTASACCDGSSGYACLSARFSTCGHQSQESACGDSWDNDCDGRVDCGDPDCRDSRDSGNFDCCDGHDSSCGFDMSCTDNATYFVQGNPVKHDYSRCKCEPYSAGASPSDPIHLFADIPASHTDPLELCSYNAFGDFDRFINVSGMDPGLEYLFSFDISDYGGAGNSVDISFWDDDNDQNVYTRSKGTYHITVSKTHYVTLAFRSRGINSPSHTISFTVQEI